MNGVIEENSAVPANSGAGARMTAISLRPGNPAPALVAQEQARPVPGGQEVLIRVLAAGVMVTELHWYPTLHTKTGEPRRNAVPGHEFSGVIAGIGPDVGSLELGREIFGMNDWYADGAMAEYCTAGFDSVAPKPERLTHAEAASVPISALTAWQGLFDRARLQPGERVLVHGGAGGVGVFAIQLAKLHGAHVITTAAAHNAGLVTELGARETIDYRTSRFEDLVKDIDVVFDAAGGDSLERSWRILKPGGRAVTIVSSFEDSADRRIQEAFFIVEPNQKQLYQVRALLDSGRLRTVVDRVVPLAQAPEAFAGKAPGTGRGKVVVSIASPEELHHA